MQLPRHLPPCAGLYHQDRMSGMHSPQETVEPRLDQLAFGCCSSFSAIQTLMID